MPIGELTGKVLWDSLKTCLASIRVRGDILILGKDQDFKEICFKIL